MTQRDSLLDAARRASDILTQFNVRARIDDGFTRVDPDGIAGSAGVVVLYKALDKLLGGFLREDGHPGIMVNVARSRGLVHMTCAHELGHFFLNHDSTTDETIDYSSSSAIKEQEANFFAYNLLAPQWLIARTMRRMGWTTQHLVQPSIIYQMSLRLGVSYSGMLWSLVRIKVLAASAAESLRMVKPRQLKLESLRGQELVDSNRDVWVLGKADKDCIIEPAPGDQFVLDLPNHLDGGHMWGLDELASEGFSLQPITRDARIKPKSPASRDVVVGTAKPTTQYSLVPPADVTADDESPKPAAARLVSLQERAPWAKDAFLADAMQLRTQFELVQAGFSRAERERRLAPTKAQG